MTVQGLVEDSQPSETNRAVAFVSELENPYIRIVLRETTGQNLTAVIREMTDDAD